MVIRIVVAEAPKILFERAAPFVQSLDDQHGPPAPIVTFQRLLVAPDRNPIAVIHYQNARQPPAAPAGSDYKPRTRSPSKESKLTFLTVLPCNVAASLHRGSGAAFSFGKYRNTSLRISLLSP